MYELLKLLLRDRVCRMAAEFYTTKNDIFQIPIAQFYLWANKLKTLWVAKFLKVLKKLLFLNKKFALNAAYRLLEAILLTQTSQSS